MRGSSSHRRRVATGVLALAALGLVVGCGADTSAAGAIVEPDVPMFPDLGDVPPFPDAAADGSEPGDEDGASDDAGPAADTDPGDTPTAAALQGPQSPPTTAVRASLALGAGRAAWVERDTPGGAPTLVVWELDGSTEPRTLNVPNLVDPRELVLTEGFLFYVDGRFGDPDVFGVRLSSDTPVTVVATQGEQSQITARGGLVAWRDCRDCLDGDPAAAGEIYQRDLALGTPEERLTTDGADDRLPMLAELVDGAPALAWIRGASELHVSSASGEVTVGLAHAAGAAAFTQGVVISRPEPFILNPDSMMPSDLLLTSVASGTSAAITLHAELEPALVGLAGPVAAAGRVSWIESIPGEAPLRRVRLADVATAEVVQSLELEEASTPALAEDLWGFVLPRAENADLPDVRLLPLAP